LEKQFSAVWQMYDDVAISNAENLFLIIKMKKLSKKINISLHVAIIVISVLIILTKAYTKFYFLSFISLLFDLIDL